LDLSTTESNVKFFETQQFDLFVCLKHFTTFNWPDTTVTQAMNLQLLAVFVFSGTRHQTDFPTLVAGGSASFPDLKPLKADRLIFLVDDRESVVCVHHFFDESPHSADKRSGVFRAPLPNYSKSPPIVSQHLLYLQEYTQAFDCLKIAP
jgi:hypothetical protein